MEGLFHFFEIDIRYIIAAFVAASALRLTSALCTAAILLTTCGSCSISSIVHLLRSGLECGIQFVCGSVDFIQVLRFMSFFQSVESSL